MNIHDLANSILQGSKDVVNDVITKLVPHATEASGPPEPVPLPVQKSPSIRGVPIDKNTFDSEVRPIIFGEVSNRDASKKELEARVILNTGINRAVEYQKRGDKNMDLKGVFTQPNQYQAYGGSQYKMYKTDTGDELTLAKKKEVDGIMDKLWGEISQGKFDDVTNNSAFYVHEKDGSIRYDDKKKLFAE